jgi:hypothetical protein
VEWGERLTEGRRGIIARMNYPYRGSSGTWAPVQMAHMRDGAPVVDVDDFASIQIPRPEEPVVSIEQITSPPASVAVASRHRGMSHRLSSHAGFWAVAGAFAAMTAFSTTPWHSFAGKRSPG